MISLTLNLPPMIEFRYIRHQHFGWEVGLYASTSLLDPRGASLGNCTSHSGPHASPEAACAEALRQLELTIETEIARRAKRKIPDINLADLDLSGIDI